MIYHKYIDRVLFIVSSFESVEIRQSIDIIDELSNVLIVKKNLRSKLLLLIAPRSGGGGVEGIGGSGELNSR